MYDSGGALEVRLLDGPGVATPLTVTDTAAEASLSTLAATVSGGKVQVLVTGGGGSSVVATTATAVAAAAAAAAVRTGSGYLCGVSVTAQGTAAVQIRDGGASGTILATVPANEPVGDIPIYSPKPYGTSLWVASGSGSPAITVFYV